VSNPEDLAMGKRRLASNRSRRATFAILALLPATLLMGMGSSTIGPDEVVVFYPTAGYRSGDGWTVPIHGVIYKPKEPRAFAPPRSDSSAGSSV